MVEILTEDRVQGTHTTTTIDGRTVLFNREAMVRANTPPYGSGLMFVAIDGQECEVKSAIVFNLVHAFGMTALYPKKLPKAKEKPLKAKIVHDQ